MNRDQTRPKPIHGLELQKVRDLKSTRWRVSQDPATNTAGLESREIKYDWITGEKNKTLQDYRTTLANIRRLYRTKLILF